MVWGYVAGALAGAALDYVGNRKNQDRQNEATRELWRQAPSDQMEGFRRAGLNPMLAYGRIDFPGSSANFAQSNFGSAITQGMQAAAANEASAASAKQAATQSRQVDANVEKIEQEVSNLKTEQDKARATIDLLREQYQNAVKEGYNITEVGNQIRATINKLQQEGGLLAEQQIRTYILSQLDQLDLEAAKGAGNFGREMGQLKPLFDIIRSVLRPR